MASKENGESPPIVILSSFIGGINNDSTDPCNPRMSHLEQKSIYKYNPSISIYRYRFQTYFAILSEQDKLLVGSPLPGLVRKGPTI